MEWIDTLPEEVLCHILSFLPTKQAAVTSVLSKRWQSLWKLVPNLDIDDTAFLHPGEGKGERDTVRQSFVDFVDRTLARQAILPLSLKCITCVHSDTVNRWICNVLQRGVLDLDLFIDFSEEDTEEDDYRLPLEMFDSRTLVKLKIRSEHCVDWWHCYMGPCLPMLKSLYIDLEMIFCGEMESFLSSFPALEELRMANMEWPESNETMSSASLTKLSIHVTGSEEFENPESISFDTPNLLYLNYSDLVAEDYPIVNMGKLFEARLNLIVKNEGPSTHYTHDYAVREFLSKYYFLLSCPVKVLEITRFWGTIGEFVQIKRFLEKLPCLELLKVSAWGRDEKAKLKLATDLLMLPRACKIQLEFFSAKPRNPGSREIVPL